MAIPDWVFRVLGAGVFTGLIALEVEDFFVRMKGSPEGFWGAFWTFGLYWKFNESDRSTLYLPWGRILYILTYVIIALSFIVRMPPRSRASRPREIIIPLIGAFWPFLPFAMKHIWMRVDEAGGAAYAGMMFDQQMQFPRFLLGSGLIILGNGLDVWAYGVLCRSLSIVAEARELKITGPYRFVRHPVYLGQILAQAGVWFCYATPHPVWWVFYGCFVAMQLYRSKVEDEVLERAFGERHREWKRRTFWFF